MEVMEQTRCSKRPPTGMALLTSGGKCSQLAERGGGTDSDQCRAEQRGQRAEDRRAAVAAWARNGGILAMNIDRLARMGGEELRFADILVCDEAHRVKNERTKLWKVLFNVSFALGDASQCAWANFLQLEAKKEGGKEENKVLPFFSWEGLVPMVLIELSLPPFRLHLLTDNSQFEGEAEASYHRDTCPKQLSRTLDPPLPG